MEILLTVAKDLQHCFRPCPSFAQNVRSGHHILIGYGGGGGSRTPVRKALRPEAYMLSSIRLGSPAAVRMSKKRNRLVR